MQWVRACLTEGLLLPFGLLHHVVVQPTGPYWDSSSMLYYLPATRIVSQKTYLPLKYSATCESITKRTKRPGNGNTQASSLLSYLALLSDCPHPHSPCFHLFFLLSFPSPCRFEACQWYLTLAVRVKDP
jgi:hypothetical protein